MTVTVSPSQSRTSGTQINLLRNGSFETGMGWSDEHTTSEAPTYSLTTVGVVDGKLAQKYTYVGQKGDNGKTSKTEIFQAPQFPRKARADPEVLDLVEWRVYEGVWHCRNRRLRCGAPVY